MRLKLVSDGTPAGSRVVDAATGEPLEDVVDFSLAPEGTGLRLTVTVRIAEDAPPVAVGWPGWIPADTDPRK